MWWELIGSFLAEDVKEVVVLRWNGTTGWRASAARRGQKLARGFLGLVDWNFVDGRTKQEYLALLGRALECCSRDKGNNRNWKTRKVWRMT